VGEFCDSENKVTLNLRHFSLICEKLGEVLRFVHFVVNLLRYFVRGQYNSLFISSLSVIVQKCVT